MTTAGHKGYRPYGPLYARAIEEFGEYMLQASVDDEVMRRR
jgi:hypothetical protein